MWNLYVRDPNLNRVGEVDDFESCDAIVRFNDVGSWTLTMDGRSPMARLLSTPGYGLDLVRDDAQVFISGPVTRRQIKQDGDSRTLVVSGTDDMVWLKRRLAHPQPSTPSPGPYSAQEWDVRTGGVSQVILDYAYVNLGPGADTPRQVAGIVIDYAGTPPIFIAVTGRARWQNLLTMLQELAIAGGNCGFRMVRSGTSTYFRVYTPVDLSSTVVISSEMGNLYGYEYESEASTVNYVYLGADGEGTARTIREGSDSDEAITWGRVESFTDRRDTTVTDEMDQEITKNLTDGQGKTGLTVNPVDISNMTFLVDYNLGDRVSYVLDGVKNTEVVREAHVSLTPDGPQLTVPTLAAAGRQDILGVFRRVRELEARVIDLERR